MLIRTILSSFVIVLLLSSCAKKQDDDNTAPVSSGYHTVAVSNGGSIKGRVMLSGPRSAIQMIETQKDQDACGAAHPNPADPGPGTGIAGCVVAIEHVSQGKAFTNAKYSLDQHGCDFTPHIQIIPIGSTITVTNSDAALHNYHIRKGDATIVNEAQPEGAPPREVELKTAGALSIGCDVHPWMRGFIYVVENPYFALTDSSGSFTISDIPEGDYTLKLWRDNWHVDQMKDAEGRIGSYKWGEDLTRSAQVHVTASKDTTIQFVLP